MRWLYVLLLASIAILPLCMAEEQLPIKLPPYILPGTAEKLVQERNSNFYKHFQEDAAGLERFMENQENVEILLDMAGKENTPCVTSMIETAQDFLNGESYALQMNDAMGRRESGLYKGNIWWLGRFYECRDIENSPITTNLYVLIFGAQEDAIYGLELGLCLPGICEANELEDIFQSFIPGNLTHITVIDPPEHTLEPVDIAAIVIFSFIGALVIGGTIVHMVINKKANRRSTAPIDQNKEDAMPTSIRLSLSFSIIKNTQILFNTNRKEGNLSALDGIRFISMAWVILGHTLSTMTSITDNLGDLMSTFLRNGSILAIANGTFSVDTFFFLSGLLVAYLGLKEMDKRNGKLNVPLMYLSRYIRLTPCMAAVMFFTVSLLNNIGDGPIYNLYIQKYDVELCQKYWWPNLLYINNFYPTLNSMCIGWVWYLANDMQFYLLSPIFLLVFYKSKKASICVVTAVILASAASTGALSAVFNIPSDIVNLGYTFNYYTRINYFTFESETTAEPLPVRDADFFADTYAKPWCRIGVYMIGMATGYFIHVTKRKVKINPVFVVAMWIIVMTTGLSIIYCFWPSINQFYLPSQEVMSFYNAVSRPLWGLCLSWVTIACVTGYGGPINAFLSWKSFLPVSRLTFCAYLIHVNVIFYMYFSREIELHFTISILIYYYLATLTLSYALAYLLSMALEAPVAGLMRIAFPKKKSKPKVEQKEMVIANHMNGGEKVHISDDDYEMADIKATKLSLSDDVIVAEKF